MNILELEEKLKKIFRLRHNVILFKEPLVKNEKALSLINKANVLIQIGTSGVVYPVAGYIDVFIENQSSNKVSICINKERPKNSGGFDFFFEEDSDEIIKEIVRIISL